MVITCNICNQNIGPDAHYIFDKIHCSIKCKNIYKKIMDDKKLGPNELYYEREYFLFNRNKKNNSFSSISNNSFNDLKIKNRFTLNHNSISCPIIERPSTPIFPTQKMDENHELGQNLKEIVIHNEKNNIIDFEEVKKKHRGYFQVVKDFSLECFRYLGF